MYIVVQVVSNVLCVGMCQNAYMVVISKVLKLPQVEQTFENTFHFLGLDWGASPLFLCCCLSHSTGVSDPSLSQKSSGADRCYCGLWGHVMRSGS